MGLLPLQPSGVLQRFFRFMDDLILGNLAIFEGDDSITEFLSKFLVMGHDND